MSFDYPHALFAFTVFIPLIIFDIAAVFKNARKDGAGAEKPEPRNEFSGGAVPRELAGKLKLSVLFFRLFAAFAIIALAGPRWGTGSAEHEYRRGLDIVYAVDVSRSMDIRDAQSGSQTGFDRLRLQQTPEQSRLERGLVIARLSAREMTGARMAAAIGRGKGLLAVPLTWDSETVLSFLETLDGSSMTGRSTNLEALVNAAADSFVKSSPARRVIVLVSDGESHSGALINAVNRCVREGIIINAVALGRDEGSPLQEDGVITDGSLIISRRDRAAMQMAAERTGGVYIDGSQDNAALELTSRLLSTAQDAGSAGRSGAVSREPAGKEPKERRSFFIMLAAAAYGISKFVTRIFRRKTTGAAAAAIFMLSAMFFSCSEGKLLLMEANYLSSQGRHNEAIVPYLKALEYDDAAPYAEYGLGLTFYQLDEGTAALKRFDNSKKMMENIYSGDYREHRELRYRTSYNTGIVFFEEGDFNSAAAAFKDALRADSGRIDAKRNLELSLMSIAREESTGKRGGQRKENESKDILFEYLKQEEQQRWKSREWSPEEEFSGADY